MINKKILHLGLTHLTRDLLLKPFYTLDLIKPKPIQINLVTTLSCNAKCKQCTIWKNKHNKKKELSTEEWKKIILKLKKWLRTYRLVFTGGESTLREDLPELISFASDLDLFTAVNTNLLLKDKSRLLSIIDSGPDVINISLDSTNPKTHDFVRGVNGAFDRLIENIEFIKNYNKDVKIRIITILSKNNLDEIEELIKWVNRNMYYIYFQTIVHSLSGQKECDQNWQDKNPLWPKDKGKINKTINKIILMKQRGYRIGNSIEQLKYMKMYFFNEIRKLKTAECVCYKKNIMITPQGNILLCRSMPPMGNILSDDIKFLWQHKSKRIIQEIKKCKRSCILLNCNFEESTKIKVGKFIRAAMNYK